MGIAQKDITGKKYGKLTAIRWVRTEKHLTCTGREVYHNFWEFACDCGNIKTLRKGRVTSGQESIKSCGCSRMDRNKNTWTGYKDISGTHWGVIKKGAKNRHIKFSISIKHAWKVYEQQNGKCKLSGVDIVFVTGRHQGWDSGTTASLDRIDSKKGYIKGNVQWVHKDLNVMKWDNSNEEFIEWCRRVSRHNLIKGD